MNELVPKADIGGERGGVDTTKQINTLITSTHIQSVKPYSLLFRVPPQK